MGELPEDHREEEAREEASLQVKRDGEARTFSGRLSENPQAPKQALVGVQPVPVVTDYGPLESVGLGIKQTGSFAVLYADGIYQLVTGQINFFDNVSGPVGIVGASSELVSQGVYHTLPGGYKPYIGYYELVAYIAA